jgi:hypothetical protein
MNSGIYFDDIATRADLVDTFNSLSLPNGYIYVDEDLHVHLIMINPEKSLPNNDSLASFSNNLSAELAYAADIIWAFTSTTSSWKVIKDRTGLLRHLDWVLECVKTKR